MGFSSTEITGTSHLRCGVFGVVSGDPCTRDSLRQSSVKPLDLRERFPRMEFTIIWAQIGMF